MHVASDLIERPGHRGRETRSDPIPAGVSLRGAQGARPGASGVSRAGCSRTPLASMLTARHAWLEGARLTQERQREENMGPYRDPGSEAGKHIGLAAEAQVISCSASRRITATERRRALQVRGHTGADGARPGSFVVLYRTTQPDIAVQDTARSAAYEEPPRGGERSQEKLGRWRCARGPWSSGRG